MCHRPVARGCNRAIAHPIEKKSTIVIQKSLNRLSDLGQSDTNSSPFQLNKKITELCALLYYIILVVGGGGGDCKLLNYCIHQLTLYFIKLTKYF